MKRSEAIEYRQHIEAAVQSLGSNIAVRMMGFHPVWKPDMEYMAGYKVQYNNKLWRTIQTHTSQEGWEPSTATASIWTEICESHAGTLEDPIPYNGNMALESGKYYSQDGKVYRCTRDIVNPVYNALSELVGLYVEKV